MSTPEKLHEILSECCEQLVERSSIIRDIPLEPKGENIYRIGKALAEVSDLRAELYKLHPHLRPEKWGETLTKEDYREMFDDAVTWAEEYIQLGRPEKAVEILEQFIFIAPDERIKSMAKNKVQELKNEFAL